MLKTFILNYNNMDDFHFIQFKNFDIPKTQSLDISVHLQESTDDFIYVDNVYTSSMENEPRINISKNLNILDEMEMHGNFEGDIIVPLDYFIDDIKGAYSNKKNDAIWQQCEVDLDRCRIFINNHRVKTITQLQNFLEFKYTSEISTKIAMLTTQALLGLPFEALFNNIDRENYHIGELDDKYKLSRREKKNLKHKRKPYRISIDLTDKKISFKAYKEFRIFLLDKHSNVNNLYRVYVKLEFDLEKSDSVLINVKVVNY